eukprot:3148657-Pyramimonas_sp.AAC.1
MRARDGGGGRGQMLRNDIRDGQGIHGAHRARAPRAQPAPRDHQRERVSMVSYSICEPSIMSAPRHHHVE